KCTGYCPISFQGYDPLGNAYWYTALDCTQPAPQPIIIVSADRSHRTGGNCDDCVDCIQQFIGKPGLAPLPAHLLAGSRSLRRAFRKGVPCPHNDFAKLDEFQPGPNSAVLAEYTAEFHHGGHKH